MGLTLAGNLLNTSACNNAGFSSPLKDVYESFGDPTCKKERRPICDVAIHVVSHACFEARMSVQSYLCQNKGFCLRSEFGSAESE